MGDYPTGDGTSAVWPNGMPSDPTVYARTLNVDGVEVTITSYIPLKRDEVLDVLEKAKRRIAKKP